MGLFHVRYWLDFTMGGCGRCVQLYPILIMSAQVNDIQCWRLSFENVGKLIPSHSCHNPAPSPLWSSHLVISYVGNIVHIPPPPIFELPMFTNSYIWNDTSVVCSWNTCGTLSNVCWIPSQSRQPSLTHLPHSMKCNVKCSHYVNDHTVYIVVPCLVHVSSFSRRTSRIIR